jgi:hypothetical protein
MIDKIRVAHMQIISSGILSVRKLKQKTRLIPKEAQKLKNLTVNCNFRKVSHYRNEILKF